MITLLNSGKYLTGKIPEKPVFTETLAADYTEEPVKWDTIQLDIFSIRAKRTGNICDMHHTTHYMP